MDYTNFLKYPLQIVGISQDYDEMIQAIYDDVVSEIAYSGETEDLESILPYFVFWFFCQEQQSTVVASVGESLQAKEFSDISFDKQINAWNKGAKMLATLCEENETEANEIYKSQRSWL